MDSEEKNLAGTSSEPPCGKTTKRNTESEAEQEGCPGDLQKQPHEAKKERWRLDVPNECRQPLYELTKGLDLRSTGAAVWWMLPSEINRLTDLTKELECEKGGQAIDWLLSMAPHIISLTRELGLQNGKQTLNWLVSKQTKRLLELTRLLGLDNGGQTLDYLISMAEVSKEIPPNLSFATDVPAQFPSEQFLTPTFQHPGGAEDPRSSSKQQPFVLERIRQLTAFGPSAANNSVPPLPLPTQSTLPERIATGSEIIEDSNFSSLTNAQPQQQFQSSVPLVGEKQQWNQFLASSSGLQGGQITDEYFDRNRGIPNLSNNFNRRGIDPGNGDHGGAPLQTSYTIEANANEAMNQGGKTAPV